MRTDRSIDFHDFLHISLPDTCSFEQAALAEPLSVLLHAFRRADLTPNSGRSVLIFGVGTIGLLACALARAYGASRVCAIDINQARLDFALKQGFAQQIHCLPASEKPKTTDEQVRRARENASAALSAFGMPDGFDVIFECTGAEPCIQMSVFVSKKDSLLFLLLFPPFPLAFRPFRLSEY